MLSELLARASAGAGPLTPADLRALLALETDADLDALFAAAYEVKKRFVGTKVFFRGIVEFSNVCEKNCFYCGIRRDNRKVERFRMTAEEIVSAGVWAWENGYGSVVLQSGERTDGEFTGFVEGILRELKARSRGELGITISLGEQSRETYRRWFEAGAHRYLLRIETSNPGLYAQLHPADHRFEDRVRCLDDLRELGYQVGTGVMIGLPGQTPDDLVDDLLFLRDRDIDMIGMGPYIVHDDTPMAGSLPGFDACRQLQLGLKMIAAARLFLRDVNIAATTALQALHPQGREMGLRAGANIVMPNVTDTRYRPAYTLYNNKPCLDENSSMCRGCLSRRISSIDETVGFNEWGDSPHYLARQQGGQPAAVPGLVGD